MIRDDLNDPIGLDDGQPRASGEIPWKLIAFGGCGVILASLVAFIFVTDNGLGGQPFAIAVIDRPAPTPATAKVASAGGDVTGTIPAIAGRSAATNALGDEVQNGVRIVRAGTGSNAASTTVLPSGAVILKVPDDFGSSVPSVDKRLVEKGRYGSLPRKGADGARPMDVYAGAPARSGALPRTAPRIALVVGGMGVSQMATEAALSSLPGQVTLGFAPYGSDLEAQVGRARAAGHEIVLQAPMEGYAGSGADLQHRLQSGVAPEQNLDNLHWLMSRISGYAGMMNFLGGRFLADEPALSPVLKDIATRGLYWFDDGSAAQSLSLSLANGMDLPARRADVVIDAGAKPAAIDAALKRLEAVARAQGSAIGVASALPEAMERIVPFARDLQDRGFALTPLSAMMAPSAAGVSQR